MVIGNHAYGQSAERVLDRVSQIGSIHVPGHLNIGNHQIDLAAELL